MEQSSYEVMYFFHQKQTTRLLNRMEDMSEENKALKRKNDDFKREKVKLEEENEQLKHGNKELEVSQRERVKNLEDTIEVKFIQYRFHTACSSCIICKQGVCTGYYTPSEGVPYLLCETQGQEQ